MENIKRFQLFVSETKPVRYFFSSPYKSTDYYEEQTVLLRLRNLGLFKVCSVEELSYTLEVNQSKFEQYYNLLKAGHYIDDVDRKIETKTGASDYENKREELNRSNDSGYLDKINGEVKIIKEESPLSEKLYEPLIKSQAPYKVTYTNNEVWINTISNRYKIKKTTDGKEPDLLMDVVNHCPNKEITLNEINNTLNKKQLKSLNRPLPTLIGELGFMGEELKKSFFPTRDADVICFRHVLTAEDIKNRNIDEKLLIEQIIEANKPYNQEN